MDVCVCMYVRIHWYLMIYSTDFNERAMFFLFFFFYFYLDFAYTVGVNILYLSQSIFWLFIAIFQFWKFLFSNFFLFRTNILYILWILCMRNKILYAEKKRRLAARRFVYVFEGRYKGKAAFARNSISNRLFTKQKLLWKC